MKAIQITVDEELLKELDATEEVARDGRSAVFRRAAAEYLRQRREAEIDAQYERAYRNSPPFKDDDFEGWENEGAWPDE
jgi:metal-responsive CopG/Arc/MetJ family transcriptional regulator